jgi:TrmH family RNA methyltransferase
MWRKSSHPVKEITSLHNPQVKLWTSLKQAKYRQASGLFLMEGARAVAEAVLTQRRLEAIIYSEQSLRTERARYLVHTAPSRLLYQVTDEILRRLTVRNDPAEVFAVCRQVDVPLEELRLPANPLCVVLDEPRGPGNLGITLRVADAVGVDAVIIIEPAVDLYHPAVVSTTVGSLFGPLIARAQNQAAFLAWYAAGWGTRPDTCCIATLPDAEQDYATLGGLTGPAFVLFGNEERGLASMLRRHAQLEIGIQMLGRADSLNTASAAAVILCDIVRKRGHGRYVTPQHARVPAGFEQPGS